MMMAASMNRERNTVTVRLVWSPRPNHPSRSPLNIPRAVEGDSQVRTSPGVVSARIQPRPTPTTADSSPRLTSATAAVLPQVAHLCAVEDRIPAQIRPAKGRARKPIGLTIPPRVTRKTPAT